MVFTQRKGKKMKRYLKHATILKMDGTEPIKDGGLGMENGLITYVGEHREEMQAEEVIDMKGAILMPALVNGHTHLPMTLMRSYADGHNLQDWLTNYIFPVEDRLTKEDIYWGSKLAMAEMGAGGTVFFNDMYWMMEEVVRAAEESGICGVVARSVVHPSDEEPIENSERVAEALHLLEFCSGIKNDNIKAALSVHAIYTNTEKALRYMSDLAKEHGALMHIHLSETLTENEDCIRQHGKTPTRYLEDLGFFQNPTIAAHGVFLNEEDLDILKKRGVIVVHNPDSNLKLGSGIAPLAQMLKKEIPVMLGTDGASSNNNLNMLEEVHLAAVIHNGAARNPVLIKAYDALKMACRSDLLGFNSGQLLPGKRADVIALDTNRPHFQPMLNTISNLVYSAQSGDVQYVFSGGELLYRNGEFLKVDLEEIYYHVGTCMKRLYQ